MKRNDQIYAGRKGDLSNQLRFEVSSGLGAITSPDQEGSSISPSLHFGCWLLCFPAFHHHFLLLFIELSRMFNSDLCNLNHVSSFLF